MNDTMRRRGAASSAKPSPAVEGRKAWKDADDGKRDQDISACTERGLSLPECIFLWSFLLAVNLSAALTSMIADCDETFNYWEPMHFITFGRGFQTWEYSPLYALRSYLFLLPHAFVARLWAQLALDHSAIFYVTRATQAFVCTACECLFVRSTSKRFGRGVAWNLAILLGCSPGMWVAGVAFLPSSIAALLVCLVWACWMSDFHRLAVFLGSAAVVVVWPFTGLLFVLLGLHTLVAVGLLQALFTALTSFSVWAALSFFVDSDFYGRHVLPAFEILRYNVLSKGESGGSELYGTEPWYFYLLNGTLNLTLAMPAALALLPALGALATLEALQRRGAKASAQFSSRLGLSALGYSLPGFMWLAFFSCIPHKEERFLAPAYPPLALAAAAAVSCAGAFVAGIFGTEIPARLAQLTFNLAAVVISASRILTLIHAYGAPLLIYGALSSELQKVRSLGTQREVNVCLGGEWHRFASSFFLPDSKDHIRYVRHGPVGLLPAEWLPDRGTAGIPPNQNDRNEEEPSRYHDPLACDYFVDLEFQGEAGEGDVKAMRLDTSPWVWDVVSEAKFLDAARSPQPWRSFYIPHVFEAKNTFGQYRLLRRRWPA